MLGVLLGNYRITEQLAEGAMGAVYLGRHDTLGRRVARLLRGRLHLPPRPAVEPAGIHPRLPPAQSAQSEDLLEAHATAAAHSISGYLRAQQHLRGAAERPLSAGARSHPSAIPYTDRLTPRERG